MGLPFRCGATECAASTLEAAVTAEMTISVSRTASATETAVRTPMALPASLRGAPASSGNRMSQAAMRSTPASLRPEAIAWPASPKPIKEIRGVLRRFMTQAHSGVRNAGDGWCTLGVERFDRLQAPGLALLSLRLRPGDGFSVQGRVSFHRLPGERFRVGCEHEPRACA